MRPPSVCALVLLCLAAVPARAQVVDGRVLERGSDRPMVGVTVELIAGQAVLAATRTDTVGLFVIAAAAAGTYRLAVRGGGHSLATSREFPVYAGDTAHMEVRVVAGTVLLAPVVAVARARNLPPLLAGFYDRAEANRSGRFVTRDRIDARRAMRTTDLLRSLAGISVGPTRRGGTTIRSRGCEPLVFVDGVYVPLYGMSLDDVVQPHDLEGIEVYSGPASLPANFARFRAPSCGAVLFWTKIQN
ncbi:MAG TPA: TonB-dependent receptor [Longimicrobiaceae bacterium]|nr:TonB-dependent receptor [Longimicrobiaceae bacterium]